jgi:hypothetical protein
MISRLVVMVAMVLALAGAAPRSAHADWDDRPDPAEFEDSLAPHGYWVDDAQFGHVWRPNTWWDWRPYVDGHWVWTSYGWTWASDEPWGWTFHYGRWGFSNLYGWVWTPGYVWGPAWVDWYWGDGYVGWVPLGPAGFAIVPTYWTYVHDFSFCSPRITNVVIVHDRVPPFIVHHREQGWGVRHAPDFRDIEHVSRYHIDRLADRPDHSIAPWVKHRIERGERLRERIADRDGERVIEHPARNAPEGRGRGQGPDDGWRRSNDPADRSPHVIERGHRDGDANGPMHGRTDDDAHIRPRSDDDPRTRRHDVDARPPVSHDRDDAVRPSPPPSDAGRGWVHPTPPRDQPPQRSQPFEAPRPRQTERPPSMGYHGAGGGPTFVERGHPSPTDRGTAPRGDWGSRGTPGPGGSTMQHGHAGGSAPAGPQGPGGGGDHGGFGDAR